VHRTARQPVQLRDLAHMLQRVRCGSLEELLRRRAQGLRPCQEGVKRTDGGEKPGGTFLPG